MKLSHFFIDRPVFAAVVAIFITLIGGFSYFALPVAQYPEVAPPTVVVKTSYPGASAQVVSESVATPLEQQINGVENMLYMVSQATGDGNLTLTITFKLGTDLDIAQVLVQNRVSIALSQLPQDVVREGVTVKKNSPDMLMVIHLISPDGSREQLYISNYATLQIKDVLARLEGVGDVVIFGARDYAMRIWVNPNKIAARRLTAGDIVAAIRAQNVQVASGVLDQPPMPSQGDFQLNVQTLGRLIEPRQFENIVINTDSSGRVTRLGDVARVELAAQDYGVNGYLDSGTAVPLGIFQQPGTNALDTAHRLEAAMAELSKSFPTGIEYRIIYNPTEFIAESVNEVIKTIYEASGLVVIVVLLFLQTWRASIIPIIAIPVSLIGTFAFLEALGFSLNNLSLFGLVLAIGIVVDDAIVVVENVERNLREGMTPREAAHKTMDEVGGALVAIALVLAAVFIPAAFITGISGQFFRQFAVTIAAATSISLLVSLTLSPALCAILLKPHVAEPPREILPMRLLHGFFRGFNWAFDKVAHGYGALTRGFVRFAVVVLLVYAGLVALTVWQFGRAPTGFIPEQDQGYVITVVQLPPGSSLARTDEIIRRATKIILGTKGVAHAVPFTGLDGATLTNASNAGAIFTVLKPFAERAAEGLSAPAVIGELRDRLSAIQGAFMITISPPPVRGIGNAGGFKMMVEDRRGRGLTALNDAVQGMVAANQQPELAGVFSVFNTNTPNIYANIDRVRAEMLEVTPDQVFETLEVYLGSVYVNQFNYLGRTYQVLVQADGPFRKEIPEVADYKTRNAQGKMVPLGSVANFEDRLGPYRLPRYNLYPSGEVQGSPAPGHSTGEALAVMEKLAAENLPDGFSFEWTELAYQEKLAGNTGLFVFAASVVFVFLVLAAQYESWSLPLSVILIVPMCLLAAVSGLLFRGMDVNILAQVGFIVLVGLAAKNAILIVEFARQGEAEGKPRAEAAIEAARVRLRPILMTSFAFIFGVLPLAIAVGAGAEMRQSLGTAVFFGMLGVTGFGLLFTPTFFVVIRGLFAPRGKR
jgi:hydrophobe/amphiphile efflux-1 (HAE1) family protein